MSTGVRVEARVADQLARELVAFLESGATRIEVAGSLRRRSPDVGDVEIVAESKRYAERSGFFEKVELWHVDRLVDALIASGRLDRLSGGDRYTKLRDPSTGLQVDLFTVKPPASWGVILTIRTGPAAFSQRLVTDARRRGLHVREGALHKGSFSCDGNRFASCPVIDTPDEDAFFAALGIPFVAPEHRV